MVPAWMAVKEPNLLRRLTSSAGAGEEQALGARGKKNTRYGKVPAARLAGETVKQLPVGFLEGGQEKQRGRKKENSSPPRPEGRRRRLALGDPICPLRVVRVASLESKAGKAICKIMLVAEQHHPTSEPLLTVGLSHLCLRA